MNGGILRSLRDSKKRMRSTSLKKHIMLGLKILWCVALGSLPAMSEALDPIVVRGNRLYNSKTRERFFVKGITYENAVSKASWDKYGQAAFKLIEDLQVNAVRLYNINPDEDYTDFMQHLDAKGIYVMVSLTPSSDDYFGGYKYCNLRTDGTLYGDQKTNCYPTCLLDYGKRVLKTFAQFDHTLAGVVGNEIMFTNVEPGICVKQYVADLKSWMISGQDKMRVIPLAYAAVDAKPGKFTMPDRVPVNGVSINKEDYWAKLRMQMLLCDDSTQNGVFRRSIDIFMINTYRWCSNKNDQGAMGRYQDLHTQLTNAPIPVVMGEYDCSENPRIWGSVKYVFSASMSDIWSGGFAYSFGSASQASSIFAVITGGDGKITGNPGSGITSGYTNLKTVYTALALPNGEDGGWNDTSLCSWVPPAASNTSSDFSPKCTDVFTRIKTFDANYQLSWADSSRGNRPCKSTGPCIVDYPSGYTTTQASLCGGVFNTPITGGGVCGDDYGCHGGKCAAGVCDCPEGTYGDYCEDGVDKTDFKLSNNGNAILPATLIVTLTVVLGLAAFGILYWRYQKKVKELQQTEKELAMALERGEIPEFEEPRYSHTSSVREIDLFRNDKQDTPPYRRKDLPDL